MGDAYPELRTNASMIEQTIVAEEKRFDAVLTDGCRDSKPKLAKALETPEPGAVG
jgi:alanyl-tRNA synthetase